MYGWDTLVLLKHLLEQKLPKTVIARRLGISRRLVYHLIKTGQLERDLSVPLAPPPRERRPHALVIEPYKPIITTRLETYPELSAVRLFEECRLAGYAGSLTQLKVFVRQVRPTPPVEEIVRFETDPGRQAQADFAEFRFPWGKRYALLVVLGYSRLLWIKFYERQTMQVVIAGLEDAFGYFGGVPKEILFDQMKAVIIGDERLKGGETGGKLLENPEFLRFAAHWDFRIRACRPHRPQTKGKIERPVNYVRDNFVYGREFLGDADLDAQARIWLDHTPRTANERVHGTTHEIPRVRFERDERAVLTALAHRPYQSLVLAPERYAAPASARVLDPRLHPKTPALAHAIAVERRKLTTYTQLVEQKFEQTCGKAFEEMVR